MSDKTEAATPRRLRRAREQGDTPASQALTRAVGFVAALTVVPAALGALVTTSAARLVAVLELRAGAASPWELTRDVLVLSLPLLGVVSLASLAAGVVQSGGVVSFKKLAPDLQRLNVVSGLRQLWSTQRASAVLRALITASVVAWAAFDLVRAQAPSLVSSPGAWDGAWTVAAHTSRRLGWTTALVGLALGFVDLGLSLRAWLERNKMTKDEVKREHKESEGDPELRSARQRAHQEVLASASIAKVREATVLIVNPTHLCTALRYDAGDEASAPRVLAHGEGELARRMLEAAHHWNVPVVRDVPLARALQELQLDEEIPEALYEAVAAVLRELWEAEQPAAEQPAAEPRGGDHG